MSKVVFEPVEYRHTSDLISEMRATDRAELWALNRADPATAVRQSVDQSHTKTAAVDDDGLVCIFGVAKPEIALGGSGIIWLLGTDRMQNHKATLLRESRQFVKAMLKHYDRLENVVWDGNMPSIMYLEAVGFKLSKRHETLRGDGYYRFWMDRNDV